MSVTTKIESPGLARDSAPEVGSGANALRRAENIVIRSPGVMETRPSFDLLYENASTTARVRALREFRGSCLVVEQDGSSWHVRNASTGAIAAGVSAEPVSYDASETKFAEARSNLYLTTLGGVAAMESATGAVRATGVSMRTMTDLAATRSVLPANSCAYRIVFVRKDSNGYIRRSSPSQRFICSLSGSPQLFGSATRVYFPTYMTAGDQIEFYRSVSLPGLSPRPDHFLALTYTISAADVARGYGGPIDDTTVDAALGAELYSDAAVGTAIVEKFPPPQAQALAFWQRCMWFGNIKQSARLVLDLNAMYYDGIASWSAGYAVGRQWTLNALNGDAFDVPDTTGLLVGMHVSDDLRPGAGVNIGRLDTDSHVVSIVGTTVTLDHHATAAMGTTVAPVGLPMVPPLGLDAFSLTCSWTAGSTAIGVLYTKGLRDGMYVFGDDPSSQSPAVDSAFPAGTRIKVVGGFPVASAPALTTNGAGTLYFGDVVTVQGVEFYAYKYFGYNVSPEFFGDAVHNRVFCISGQGLGGTTGGPLDDLGQYNRALAVQALANAINVHYFATGSPFPSATLIGDQWDARDHEHDSSNIRTDPGTLATAFVLESDFATPIAVSCTCINAFPMDGREVVTVGGISFTVATQVSDNPSVANRVHFSDVDEPESAPLLNYIDIGALHSPILALVPLRNALLVFKSDGLWRITGSSPNWSVDPLDNTMTLLRPELVSVSQNKAYCWAKGGFYEVDESGSRSLSAGKLDVELREHALYMSSNTTHGAFVAVVQERNIVLLGVPPNLGGKFTEKVFCYHQTTGAWTEWPVSWGKVAESASFDRLYQSRPEAAASTGLLAIDVEVRRMLEGYTGLDRWFALGDSLMVAGSVITIDDGDFGTWRPAAGDWISATDGTLRVYRRILTAVHNGGGTWTITLEAEVPDGSGGDLITDAGVFFVTDGGDHIVAASLMGWRAHEGIRLAVEWHPTAPKGLPVGALARELQFELDLRKAPDPKVEDSLPEYIAGGSTERDISPHTLTSNMTRVATVQQLRMGLSRQVARGALVAPYFQTSDIFAMRLVGASIVHEGTSERTRR